MREISFRAWDKRFKTMIYDRPMAILYLQDEDHEIMQFTSLLDRNQREIFEGDIVRFLSFTYEIKWFEGGAWRFEPGGYLFEQDTKKMEVIGNRWENPELLDGR